jgi:hypothetical protein
MADVTDEQRARELCGLISGWTPSQKIGRIAAEFSAVRAEGRSRLEADISLRERVQKLNKVNENADALVAENVRLRALLDGRDAFIVDAGLWADFVRSLPLRSNLSARDAPRAALADDPSPEALAKGERRNPPPPAPENAS